MGSTVTRSEFIKFFLWGHIKTNIYETKVDDIDDLKARIMDEIEAIKKDTLSNVFLEIKKRLTFCIEVHGGSFEQYF
jgi:hypothetical protein